YRVAGDAVHRLSISRKREGAVPLTGPAIEKPKVEEVRLGSDRGRNAHDRFKVTVDAVAQKVTLNEGHPAGRLPQLIRTYGVAKFPQKMPRELRAVVITEVLPDHVSMRHQHLEISLFSPVPLDHYRISSDPIDRMSIGRKLERAVPFAGPAIEKPKVE